MLRNSIRNKNFSSNEPNLIKVLYDGFENLNVMETIAETIADTELVFIIVPTPSLESGHFSNRYVLEVIREIGTGLRTGKKIVVDIVSTVMPGSCEGEIRNELEKSSNRKIGSDLGLCYNPEFIALGSVINDMEYPDMHLIGESSKWAGDVVSTALNSIVKRDVPVMKLNLIEAELVKISINNFVTMKISFANVLMQSASKLKSVNIDSVTNAIGLDSRVGGKYLKAATPYGGPCFPRDTRALSAFLNDLGINPILSLGTETINNSHLEYIYNLITKNINTTTTIGVVGLSYKLGTSVVDESPGLLLSTKLIVNGYTIKIWDDEGAKLNSEFPSNTFEYVDSGEELIAKSQLILITRTIKNESQFFANLISSKKPFLDLWRHI